MLILKRQDNVIAKGENVNMVVNGYLVDNLRVYCVPKDEFGNFVGLESYSIVEVARWPEDYVDGKYNYIDGQYVVSQEYLERKEVIEQAAIDKFTEELIAGGVL